MRRREAIALIAALIFGSLAPQSALPQADEQSFQFGLIGDVPYANAQEQEFQRVLAALNAADLAFVIHVGDMQGSPGDYYSNPSAGLLPCTDQRYQSLFGLFQGIRHPVMLTPGDNDWTGCHLVREPKLDPLERLTKLRDTFYANGRSLGQRSIKVESQAQDHPQFAKYRENLRWSVGGVTFGTLHIVGSNDNFGRTADMNAEHAERKLANIAWLRALFAVAKASNSRGLVLMSHANPGFENYWPQEAKHRYFRPFVARGQPIPSYPTAFDDYVTTLGEEMERFDKPVAFLHGDTHLFRIDKPLYSRTTNRPFENFTRLETFGDPDTHWVRITIDPADAQLFRFDAQIVAGNAANRR